MRRSIWLVLAASLLNGKAAGLPTLHSSSWTQPGWLSAPRAGARFGGRDRVWGRASPARLSYVGGVAGIAGRGGVRRNPAGLP